MPTVKASGLQNGASPITSGNGTTQGVLEAREGASSVPGLLKLYTGAGAAYYFNIGSGGVPRVGINDPSSDPDLNESIAAIAGGLEVSGANWMTGRFMSTDLRLSSRANVLASVNDDFDDASIDTTLWSATGTPTEASGHLQLNSNGEGLRSTYLLDGDLDVRAEFTFDSFGTQAALVLDLAFGATARGQALGAFNLSNHVGIAVGSFSSGGSVSNVRIRSGIDSSSGTEVLNVTSGVNISNNPGSIQVRIVRAGNTFTLYYRYIPTYGDTDISSDAGWIQVQTGSYDPGAENAQARLGTYANVGGITGYVERYRLQDGSPVPSSSNTGPAWKMDSLAILDAAETWMQWFNGPSTTAANEIMRLTTDADLRVGLLGTKRGTLEVVSDGANAPGLLRLYEDDDATDLYLWVEGGVLRSHTSKPSASSDGQPVWSALAVSGWSASGFTGTRTLDGTESTVADVIAILGQLIEDLLTQGSLKAP